MRYAIVDNSTLTAIQRLRGEVPVVNTFATDGDIAAFENLIQTILFYDQIFYIDDYKEQFREQRRKSFGFLQPLDTKQIAYDAFATAASQSVADLCLKVAGGKIDKNELGQFLETLKLHTTFTWDMQSSNFFLNMKMLSGESEINVDKYSALMNTIFLELSNNEGELQDKNKRYAELIGSDGRKIPQSEKRGQKKYEVTKQVYAFSSSLNWLSLRTAFYTLVGAQYSADAILHPIRCAFQISFAERLGLDKNTFAPVIDRLNSEAIQAVAEIRKNTDPIIVDMRLPLFSAWMATKKRTPSEIIEEALELRKQEVFVSARTKLIELEELAQNPERNNFVAESNKLVQEIAVLTDKLRQIYNVKTRSGVSISPLISLINVFARLKGLPGIPNIPIKVPLPNRVLEIGNRKGFKGIYRSITQDLTAVSKLGEYHEILSSEIKLEKDAGPIPFKTEDKKFFGKASDWKQPM